MEKKEPESVESPLERLRKRLYGSEKVDVLYKAKLTEEQPSAPEHWRHAPDPIPGTPRKHLSASTLFLLSAAAFFLIAGIAAAVVLFLGGRSVSADHIDFMIEGPTTVEGGEIASFFVVVKNNNPVAVEGARLSITFPEGVTDPDAPDGSPRSRTEALGTILPGESARVSARASFLGEEGEKLAIPLLLEYQTEGSNATFVKKEEYEVIIGTAPVSLIVETTAETASGQPIAIVVRVRSNVAGLLENVAVRPTAYPSGFSLTSATPAPSASGLYSIGTLAPGEEKQIRIDGILSGVDGDERVFGFTAGALTQGASSEFAISYATNSTSVRIARPFLAATLSLNQQESTTAVFPAGETVQGYLSWENAIPEPILDGSIAIRLSGNGYDPSSVSATGGFYRSADRTIIFDKQTTVDLARLEPGETGTGVFSLMMRDVEDMLAFRNPSVTLSLSVSGRRVGAGNVPETVSSTVTRTIRVATSLSTATKALRTVGPFTNTGPWPPRADSETTYTIELNATNSVNAVANAMVRTTLPPYVRFTGKTSGGTITFNEVSREVTWAIGDLQAGAARQAYFQVALLPSTSQRGTTPVLVSETTVSGIDRFVQQEVRASVPAVNTQAVADPGYDITKGSVE